MKIFKLATHTTLAAAFFVTSIAVSSVAAQTLDTIRIGHLKVPPLIGLIYGIEAGIFEENGINLEIVIVNSVPDIVGGVMSGSLDIASLPAAGGIQARASGLPLVAIGISKLETAETADFRIVGNGDKGITRPRDLVGRVVGIADKDSPAELQIRDHMLRDGADPDTVEFVALPFPQLPSALEVGNVDAIGVPQPFLDRILTSDKINAVELGAGSIASLKEDGQAATGAWFVTEAWLGEKPDVPERFLRALIKSYRELSEDRSTINAILMRDFGMPEDVAGHISVTLETEYVDARAEDFAPLIRAYQRTGLREVTFSAEEAIVSVEYE